MNELIIFNKIFTKALCKFTSIPNLRKIVSTSQRAKILVLAIIVLLAAVGSTTAELQNVRYFAVVLQLLQTLLPNLQ